jgi:hypothetical protein
MSRGPTWDDHRTRASHVLQVIEGRINQFTAAVAETSAQRGTTPEQVTEMERLLVIFEGLRDGYQAVLEAFDRGDPERAMQRLDRVEALRARLLQRLGAP